MEQGGDLLHLRVVVRYFMQGVDYQIAVPTSVLLHFSLEGPSILDEELGVSFSACRSIVG
jgi:hypothetical protein